MSIKQKLITKIKENKYYKAFPDIYKKGCMKAVIPDKIVFVKVYEPGLYGSMGYLYSRLKDLGNYQLSTFCIGYNDLRGNEFLEHLSHLYEVIADAAWVIINEPCFPLSLVDIRPETKVLHLGHGAGLLRRFGKDSKRVENTLEAKIPEYKNVDYVIAPHEEWIPYYASAMGIDKKKILPLGSCHTDQYFDEAFKEACRKKLYELIPEAEERKIIAYIPSYRGNPGSAWSPKVFGEYKMIKERMGPSYMMLIHHHPYAKAVPNILPKEGSFTKDISQLMTAEELICCADYLITDYSSVLFDYVLQDKPMAFLGYDYDIFEERKDFYFDYPSFVPGPVCKNGYALTYRLSHDMELYDEETIRAFRNKYMTRCDGHVTDRVISLIEQG